ncbi:MAG TPA: hypothetical protein VF516_26480 [Kofleriaceae bacterium]
MDNADLTLTVLQNIRTDIAALGSRFDGLEHRFDGLEHRFDGLEHRFDGLEHRFDILERRFDTLESRFGTLETRVNGLESEGAATRKDLQACLTREEFRGAMLAMNIAQNERFERLEQRMNESDMRSAASHRELQDAIRQLTAQVSQHGSLAARVSLCERDIVDIKRGML